jgi:tetratricopeptide (TPR) repeat protein
VARTLFRLWLPLALIAAPLHPLRAQTPEPPKPAPKLGPKPATDEQEPPEEDDTLKPKEYALNPIQAQKEITAGTFYSKKGNQRAAQKRYLEATRWDPGSAEAFLKLGESSEKLHDFTTALEAYTKYLELDKNAKDADALRKRIAKWPTPRTDPAKPDPAKK